jgi:glyoxylase-like metal-dependent hydrolase (beta-lactamase superfamily II)
VTETSREHWRVRVQQSSVQPSAEELLPNLWRLVVPLPRHSVGQVNVYALTAPEGVLLIDTGWRHPAAWAVLRDLLHQAGLAITDVTRLLSTHAHPDHCGMAGTFRQEQGTSVAMHAADAACFRQRFCDPESFGQLTDRWLESAGVPAAAADASAMHVFRANLVNPVGPDIELHDRQRLVHGRWQLDVLHTPGHTAGHVCLYDRATRTLFTGDHVLQRINTSPAYRPLSEADPVGGYLASFPRLRGLAAERILPGHGRPFTGLGARLDMLERHHTARLAVTLELVCARPGTVWEVTSGIPRSSPWHSLASAARISAMAETYGHLVHLARHGLVEADGDGPACWRPVSGAPISQASASNRLDT